MIINQFAPVIEKQLTYRLKPESDNQRRSKGFIYRALISDLDQLLKRFSGDYFISSFD